VTRLEHRYARFDGLNLTWETLEGLVKHNGPLLGDGRSREALPGEIADFPWDLELASHAGPEAQVAALSDDIAYMNHDLDDGLRAGLFAMEELAAVPLAGPIFQSLVTAHPGAELGRLIGEGVRELIGRMVSDVVAETAGRIAGAAPATAADIRAHPMPVVSFSDGLLPDLMALRAFLTKRMYRHERVLATMERAQKLLTDLFGAYTADPSLMPADWRKAGHRSEAETARVACDYIAGMTDGFAQGEYRRIFHVEFPLQTA
jgi:dGTPase